MRAVKYLSNQEQVNQSASRRNNVTWVPQVNRSRVIPFHKPNKAINLSMVNKSDVILEGKKRSDEWRNVGRKRRSDTRDHKRDIHKGNIYHVRNKAEAPSLCSWCLNSQGLTTAKWQKDISTKSKISFITLQSYAEKSPKGKRKVEITAVLELWSYSQHDRHQCSCAVHRYWKS